MTKNLFLICGFVGLTMPLSVLAQASNCSTNVNSPIVIKNAQTTCVQLPKHVSLTRCTVLAINPEPKTKLNLEVIQDYYGPDMPGNTSFSQSISQVGDSFSFTGTKSPDITYLSFENLDAATKGQSITLQCRYLTK